MKRLLAFLALIFFACIASATQLAAQDLAITHVRIIVGNGNVIENGSIVARGGKIISVAAGAPNARGIQTIDAHGMTAVPGFIDAHHHLMGRNPDQYLKTEAVQDMQSFLDAGYTTVLAGLGPVPGNAAAQAKNRFRRIEGASHHPIRRRQPTKHHPRPGPR